MEREEKRIWYDAIEQSMDDFAVRHSFLRDRNLKTGVVSHEDRDHIYIYIYIIYSDGAQETLSKAEGDYTFLQNEKGGEKSGIEKLKNLPSTLLFIQNIWINLQKNWILNRIFKY